MDLNLFFSFPGILILIGVVLLILAIIIGIFAYRNVGKEEYERLYESDDIKTDDTLMDIDILMEKSLENVQNDAKEINIEVKENNLGNEEDSENTILNEEVSEAVIVPTEALDKEDEKVEEEGFVYLDEDKETFSLNQDKEEKSNEEKTILDNEEVLEERVIYGGAKPLDNVSLEFNDDVRKPIYQNQNNTQNVEEILEVTKELHLNKDENEKIEVL